MILPQYRNSAYRTANQIKRCCAQSADPSHSAKGVLSIAHTVFGRYMQGNKNYQSGQVPLGLWMWLKLSIFFIHCIMKKIFSLLQESVTLTIKYELTF